MCPIKKSCTALKIQQHSFDIRVLQTQGLYLKSVLSWFGAVEQEQWMSPPGPGLLHPRDPLHPERAEQ